jgi:hypothetical protein
MRRRTGTASSCPTMAGVRTVRVHAGRTRAYVLVFLQIRRPRDQPAVTARGQREGAQRPATGPEASATFTVSHFHLQQAPTQPTTTPTGLGARGRVHTRLRTRAAPVSQRCTRPGLLSLLVADMWARASPQFVFPPCQPSTALSHDPAATSITATTQLPQQRAYGRILLLYLIDKLVCMCLVCQACLF